MAAIKLSSLTGVRKSYAQLLALEYGQCTFLHYGLISEAQQQQDYQQQQQAFADKLLDLAQESISDNVTNKNTIIAYEPVWAIGTGTAASPDDAEDVNKLIREELASIFGSEQVSKTPILYGGSVTEDNIADFLSKPNVNGALIGGASLNSEGFTEILRIACNLT